MVLPIKLPVYLQTKTCPVRFNPWILYGVFSDPPLIDTVAYRPVAKRRLCKNRPLLGNARNIHALNNTTTVLCNPFLGNGSVNTPITIELLLEAVFCVRSVQRGYTEDSWGNRVQKSCGGRVEYLHRSPASRRRR
jgi:hypothetical protein